MLEVAASTVAVRTGRLERLGRIDRVPTVSPRGAAQVVGQVLDAIDIVVAATLCSLFKAVR